MGKRIAICFSGQIRTGIEASSSLLKFIGCHIGDVDIFIHTWNTETLSPLNLRGRDFSLSQNLVPISQEKIDKIREIYNPKLMKVDDQLLLRESTYNSFDYDLLIQSHQMVNGFLSAYESNKLKKIIEDEENFKYEYVIKLRFDQIFKSYHTLDDEIKYISGHNNRFYVCDYWNKLPEWVEDIAWISTSEIMDTVCGFVFERMLNKEMYNVDWQEHMKKFLDQNNIIAKPWNTNSLYVIRDYDIGTEITNDKF